jgi:hypothetical protein
MIMGWTMIYISNGCHYKQPSTQLTGHTKHFVDRLHGYLFEHSNLIRHRDLIRGRQVSER